MRMPNVISKIKEIFGLDIRSLALLRISVALVGLADVVLRARDAVAHYSNSGMLSEINNLWQFPTLIFILTALFFIALLLGYKTRLATFLAWVFLLLIQIRNPLLFQKSDDILALILLWGFFLPWGATYSLDASKKESQNNQKKQIFTIATFAYFIQIMLIYITAALLKSSSIWRSEGSAIFYALSSDQYTTALGYFLLSFPGWMLKILTHFVWWFELLGTFLLIIPIFNPLFRIIGIISIIGLHIGFGSTMALGLFPWICVVAMLAFIPGIVWEKLYQYLPFNKQREFILYYDNTCSFCKKIVRVFKSFLFLPDMPCVSAQSNMAMLIEMEDKDSWIISKEGKHFYRFDVFINLLSASPIFWPLAKIAQIKAIRFVGEKLYTTISDRRKKICRVARPEPDHSFEKPIFILLQLTATFFLFIMIFWNLGNVAPDNVHFPKPLIPVAEAFHLDQRWDMFAPHPFIFSSWYIVLGYLTDNSMVNLLNNNIPLSFEKPKFIKDSYINLRWKNYLTQLFSQKNNAWYVAYGKYICQTWNSKHVGEKQLDKLEVFAMSRKNTFNQLPPPYSRTLIWQYKCK